VTYLGFLGLFVVPPVVALALVTLLRTPRPPRRAWVALACYTALAVLVTAPWDSYLIAHGVWAHGDVVGRLIRVPAEEYAFMLGQCALTGLWTLLLLPREPLPRDPLPRDPLPREPLPREPSPATRQRRAAALGWLAASAACWALHPLWTRGFYLTAIVGWFGPLIALQAAVGADRLAAARRVPALAVAAPTAYLWLADRAAIAAGTWAIAPALTVPLRPLGLPLEEAVFFLITNLVLVNGILLAADPVMWARVRDARLV